MFLYFGTKFIQDKLILPEYIHGRGILDYEYIKPKLSQQMVEIMSLEFQKAFKTSKSFPTNRFVKCGDVWVYAPSLCCFLSDVKVNELVEWGITPEKGPAIHIEPCTKTEHGKHDFFCSVSV